MADTILKDGLIDLDVEIWNSGSGGTKGSGSGGTKGSGSGGTKGSGSGGTKGSGSGGTRGWAAGKSISLKAVQSLMTIRYDDGEPYQDGSDDAPWGGSAGTDMNWL